MRSWHTIVLGTAAVVLLNVGSAAAKTQRVFLSSTVSMGDIGGIEGADGTCQLLADGENLGGRWVAWLSTADVDAIDRLSGNGPFILVSTNEIIAANRTELTSGNLQNDIERTEMGAQVPASVWTGTDPNGRAAASANFCNGWADLTNGSFGQTGASQLVNTSWTKANQVFCNTEARLYCFEQGTSAVPALSGTVLYTTAALMLLIGIGVASRRRRSGPRRRLA